MTAPADSRGDGGGREKQAAADRGQFTASWPKADTLAAHALADLTAGPLTQADWLRAGKSWRLAAAINDLRERGWPVPATMIHQPTGGHPVAQYLLPDLARDQAEVRSAG